MTIQTRRVSILPWGFPCNTVELGIGQTHEVTKDPSDELYWRYKATVINPNSVYVEYTYPRLLETLTASGTKTDKNHLEGEENNTTYGRWKNLRWIP